MQPAKLDHFMSEPALLPPKITVLKHSSRSEGDIFLTPLPSPTVHPESNNAITIKPVGPGGPMIIDGRGNLVWFDQLRPPVYAINFRPQRYLGHQVLTWWQGSVTVDAFGLGEGVIADGSYGTIRTVRAGNGYVYLVNRGFETRINVNSSKSTFAVRALSATGRVLSTSSPKEAS